MGVADVQSEMGAADRAEKNSKEGGGQEGARELGNYGSCNVNSIIC